MIVDGRALASHILEEVRQSLPGSTVPVVRAVVAQATPATESYLRIKSERAEEAGMRLEVVRLPDAADEEAFIAAIEKPGADAVIVQLPVPPGLNAARILAAIPEEKDADVLSETSAERFAEAKEGVLVPPVAAAVEAILSHAGVAAMGKRAVVVGRGPLVGRPSAVLLSRLGAVVTSVDRTTEGKDALLRAADIIVSGAGVPNLIAPEMVKDGVVLIDAGTSAEKGGVAGDIDPRSAEKASVYTPVPGGVGPVAVACLFKNVAALIRARGS